MHTYAVHEYVCVDTVYTYVVCVCVCVREDAMYTYAVCLCVDTVYMYAVWGVQGREKCVSPAK